MLPTYPLRSINTIKKAINFSVVNKSNCFSACVYDFYITFGFSIDNDKWKSVFKKSPMLTGNTQSQSQKKPTHSISRTRSVGFRQNLVDSSSTQQQSHSQSSAQDSSDRPTGKMTVYNLKRAL